MFGYIFIGYKNKYKIKHIKIYSIFFKNIYSLDVMITDKASIDDFKP